MAWPLLWGASICLAVAWGLPAWAAVPTPQAGSPNDRGGALSPLTGASHTQAPRALRIFHGYPQVPGDFCDCITRAAVAGGECRLHSGRYLVEARCEVANAAGTAGMPIVIAAAGDGPVVIDGTVPLDGQFTQRPDGLWAAPSSGLAILQLFVAGELQVLARAPNAKWSDKSVFYAVRQWFRSQPPGVHNVTSGEGLLRDQGPCASPSLCCSRCNSHGLQESGVNATAALGIMNLWSCDTGVQRITRHDRGNPAILRYNATWDGLCDDYRGGDGRYFLQGTAALLDGPEEWLLDQEARQIVVAAPPRPGAEVRGRVVDYALVLQNVSWVTVANLSFVAATVSASGDVANISLLSLEFNYSAVSRRALGDSAPPVALTLWRAREADAGGPASPAGFVVDDITVRYSDGPALMINGRGTHLTDSLFEWNDWTTVGGSWPLGVQPAGKAHRATTVWVSDTDGATLTRLTFRSNGAAQAINAGGDNAVAAVVELCSFESQLAIQDDGAFVEGGGRPSTVYLQNWCTNTGKAGLRWDGSYPTVSGGRMLRNVAWNTSAMVIKGDRHNVSGNTVFDGADTSASHAAHDTPRYQDHTSALNNLSIPSAVVGAGTKVYNPAAGQLTVFSRNIFDAVAVVGAQCPTAPNCTLPGRYTLNVIGGPTPAGPGTPFDVRSELRAPYHHDFRPCPGSRAAALSAGAYSVWSPTDPSYWIPGRRDQTVATTPLPPAGSIGVHLNTELMFLPGRRATGHAVYLGIAGGKGSLITTLVGPVANIARLPGSLAPGTSYVWRVDSSVDGDVVQGSEWGFTTGRNVSCDITPHPPPQPAPPGPGTCAAAEAKWCPGLGHKGGNVGDPCYECVVRNNLALKSAGCWAAVAGGRHAFIQHYCGSLPNLAA